MSYLVRLICDQIEKCSNYVTNKLINNIKIFFCTKWLVYHPVVELSKDPFASLLENLHHFLIKNLLSASVVSLNKELPVKDLLEYRC